MIVRYLVGMGEFNLGPLEEQQVILNTEPSISPFPNDIIFISLQKLFFVCLLEVCLPYHCIKFRGQLEGVGCLYHVGYIELRSSGLVTSIFTH